MKMDHHVTNRKEILDWSREIVPLGLSGKLNDFFFILSTGTFKYRINSILLLIRLHQRKIRNSTGYRMKNHITMYQ